MAELKPILMSNYETGLENDLKPWLLPNEAFPTLENMYVFRGRVISKLGVRFIGRLTRYSTVALGVRVAPPQIVAGVFPVFPPGPVPPRSFIVRGSVAITDGTTTLIDDGLGNITGGGTIDYATGAFSATFTTAVPPGPPNITATALFIPCAPVMGFVSEDTPSINEPLLIAYDQQKAYRFDNVLQQFRDISFDTDIATQSGPFSWSGSNSDFFWSLNYANAIFTTNFVSGDPIRYLAVDAATSQEHWRPFQPPISSTVPGDRVLTTRMIVSYRGRLVFINNLEIVGGLTNPYPQRARWCQNGTPYYQTGGVDTPPAPFGSDIASWYDNQLGKGGYVDAPTREEALSCEFVDDQLVVFFENSTWMLRYLADPALPFAWERVNVDLGSESTFSTVSFDDGAFTVGARGIITSDGNSVMRIDQRIPNEIFTFQNQNEGVKRVHGIRDFEKQLVYWTFPSNEETSIFPNRVLVLNYIEKSYSFFRESFTCYGTFEPNQDTTWAASPQTWEHTAFTWANPLGAALNQQIVAGNQQGFVLQVNQTPCAEPSRCLDGLVSAGFNTPPVVTSTNHNLSEGQFIELSNLFGTGDLAQFQGKVWKVVVIVDANNFVIQDEAMTGVFNAFTYTDSGVFSVLDNIDIRTKRFNLALEAGLQTRVGRTDFYVLRDETGEFSAEMFTDDDSTLPVDSCIVSLAQEPPTNFQNEKIWKRCYMQSIGQFFQYHIFYSDAQMFDFSAKCTPFELHAMQLWVAKAGRLPY